MENGMKRWIPDEKAFNKFEFEWGKIITVPEEDLNSYPAGKNLEQTNVYPDGVLLRGSVFKDGDGIKVYIIKSGRKYWVKTPYDFENIGLSWQGVNDISAKKLKAVAEGAPITQPNKLASPLTILTAFPEQIIEDIEAEFQFNGIPGRQNKRNLTFETFIEGVDARWVTISGKSRKLNLPQKSGQYRFFVRAKDPDGIVDKIPKNYNFQVRISPLYKKLTLSSVSASSKDPTNEQFIIINSGNEPINLTGWTIGSKKLNTRYNLPQTAYEVPQHVYFPNQKEIVLPPKGKITIKAGKSPLGYSFRINQCVGYLNSSFKIAPSLPNLCPKPDQSETKKLSAYCQKIISQSAGCKEPNLNDILIDSECREYVSERFNYSQCVIRNSNFYDFFKDEWIAYLDQPKEIFANNDDIISLRDPNGLIVYNYKY